MQIADRVSAQGNLAFEREAIPWIDDVYRFALSLTRDEADADDVVQDTFLRAYRSWQTYLPGSDCRRWLFTICRNVFLRSRERSRPTVELDSNEVDAVAVGTLYSAGIQEHSDDMVARLDLAPAIHKALARIPEPFRSTLVIVDVDDQSYESAAEVLGVPIGTVRSRLFRGRRLMQEYLLNYATDAGLRPRPVAPSRPIPARATARRLPAFCADDAAPRSVVDVRMPTRAKPAWHTGHAITAAASKSADVSQGSFRRSG